MSTATEQIVRQLSEFLVSRDWEAVRQCLADSVTYHIPGHNPISGTYRGIDEALTLLTRWADHLDERPASLNVLQTSSGDQRVVMIMQRTAVVNGQQRQWIEKVAFFFHDRQIAACWLFVDNTAEFDAYWSTPLPQSPRSLHTRMSGGGTAPYSITA